MGAAAAARAGAAIAAGRPRALLAVGFCGALDPALRVGDLVAAARVRDEATDEEFAADPGLLAAAPGRRGVLVSARHIARTPQARARLRGTAVDLESAALARAARDAGIPFLALRAVTDTTDHRLPDFEAIAAGRPQIPAGRLATHVLRHPRELPRLVRLGAGARRAGRALAEGLEDTLAGVA
jgi:adenosylhomocysteine nucleosidase